MVDLIVRFKASKAPSARFVLSQKLSHQVLPLLVQLGIESLVHLVILRPQFPTVLLAEVQLFGFFVFDIFDFLSMGHVELLDVDEGVLEHLIRSQGVHGWRIMLGKPDDAGLLLGQDRVLLRRELHLLQVLNFPLKHLGALFSVRGQI